MAFKQGVPRPPNAGRKKGTPNKITTDIMKICEEEGVDPIRALIIASKTSEKCLLDLCQYVIPKRKALDHTFAPSNEELKEIIKERLDGQGT